MTANSKFEDEQYLKRQFTEEKLAAKRDRFDDDRKYKKRKLELLEGIASSIAQFVIDQRAVWCCFRSFLIKVSHHRPSRPKSDPSRLHLILLWP